MSDKTNIQWTDYTYNPWFGCRKVAEECAKCYIVRTPTFRFRKIAHGSVRVRASEATRMAPLKWNRKAEKAGEKRMVFSLSLGDWLDDENVPVDYLAELLAIIDHTPHLIWQLPTKRPQNFEKRMRAVADADFGLEIGFGRKSIQHTGAGVAQCWLKAFEAGYDIGGGHVPSNVWLGVSAGADQAAALRIPAVVHFLSCEPMLRPLDTTHAARFDWIIFGGESGPSPRVCDVDWIRRGLEFCKARKIAAFVKQLGSNAIDSTKRDIWCDGTHHYGGLSPESAEVKEALGLPGYEVRRHNVSRVTADKKGGVMEEWAEELRVREFPSWEPQMSQMGADERQDPHGGTEQAKATEGRVR